MTRLGAATRLLATFRHPVVALAARAVVFGALCGWLLSEVHSLWWALDFRGRFSSTTNVAAFLTAAVLAGAATLLSRRGRTAVSGGGAAAGAWVVGGFFLYGRDLIDPAAMWLPRMEWWTTTFRHGEVGGSVYSGWFIVAGGVMGLLFGLLTRGHVTGSRRAALWWVALATLAGAMGWGAVPAGAWIT